MPDVLKELRQDFNAIGRKKPPKAATSLTNSGITLKPRCKRWQMPRSTRSWRIPASDQPEDKQRRPCERRWQWFQAQA